MTDTRNQRRVQKWNQASQGKPEWTNSATRKTIGPRVITVDVAQGKIKVENNTTAEVKTEIPTGLVLNIAQIKDEGDPCVGVTSEAIVNIQSLETPDDCNEAIKQASFGNEHSLDIDCGTKSETSVVQSDLIQVYIYDQSTKDVNNVDQGKDTESQPITKTVLQLARKSFKPLHKRHSVNSAPRKPRSPRVPRNGPGRCNICPKMFDDYNDVEEHIKIDHRCQFCDKSFGDREDLFAHIREHLGERDIICKYPYIKKGRVFEICGKEFNDVMEDHIHENSHTRATLKERHACYLCKEKKIRISSFPNITMYNQHVAETHPLEKEALISFSERWKFLETLNGWQCPYCDMLFSRFDPLHDHRFRHGPYGLDCQNCRKTIFSKYRAFCHDCTGYRRYKYSKYP